MRWIPFLILAWLVVMAQTSLGKILTLYALPTGPVGPDLLVLLAVFVALQAPSAVDTMLAGWVLGMLVDLTTAGGLTDPTRIGPMALLFALAVRLVFALREAFFRERALPQMVLAGLFCLLAHGLWITVQVLLAGGEIGWGGYGRLLLQVLLSSVYTALLMPLAYVLLRGIRGMILSTPPSRRGRPRSSK